MSELETHEVGSSRSWWATLRSRPFALVVVLASVLGGLALAVRGEGKRHHHHGPADLEEHHALFDSDYEQVMTAAHAYARTQGIEPDQYFWSVTQVFRRDVFERLVRDHTSRQIADFADAGAPIVSWRIAYYRPLELATARRRLRITVDRFRRIVGVDRGEYRPTALRDLTSAEWVDDARHRIAEATGLDESRLRPLDRKALVGTPLAKHDQPWIVDGLELGEFSLVIGARRRADEVDFSISILRLDHARPGPDWGVIRWLAAMVTVVLALLLGLGWGAGARESADVGDTIIRVGYGIALVVPLAELILMVTSSRPPHPASLGLFVGIVVVLGLFGRRFTRGERPHGQQPPGRVVGLGLVISATLAFFIACVSCGGPLDGGCCEACGLLRCTAAPLVLVAVVLARHRPRFMAYAVILGAVMLVPHCICDNFLNHYWIASIGASPLCFFLFYATVLLTAAGLRGVRPRLALLCSVGAVISVSAIGLGHALFAFPW